MCLSYCLFSLIVSYCVVLLMLFLIDVSCCTASIDGSYCIFLTVAFLLCFFSFVFYHVFSYCYVPYCRFLSIARIGVLYQMFRSGVFRMFAYLKCFRITNTSRRMTIVNKRGRSSLRWETNYQIIVISSLFNRTHQEIIRFP